jgi:hypothetical protein
MLVDPYAQVQSETAVAVVADLFDEMESTLKADYGKAVKLTKCIDGTAFFPGAGPVYGEAQSHMEQCPPIFRNDR